MKGWRFWEEEIPTLEICVYYLLGGRYVASSARLVAEKIRAEIAAGTTTWEKLRLTDAELDVLVRRAEVTHLVHQLNLLRRGGYHFRSNIIRAVNEIKDAIATGITTFSELDGLALSARI